MKQLFCLLLLAHACLLDGYFTVIPDFNSDSSLPAFSAAYNSGYNHYYSNNALVTDHVQNSIDHIRQYRRQQYYDNCDNESAYYDAAFDYTYMSYAQQYAFSKQAQKYLIVRDIDPDLFTKIFTGCRSP